MRSQLKKPPKILPREISTRKFRVALTPATGHWQSAICNCSSHSFPFGKYAEQAQLELIYAHYRSADYESSICLCRSLYPPAPPAPNVDYAFYMKGLSEISQASGFFDSFLPTDNSKRDIGSARNAFATLSEFLDPLPQKPLRADSRKRLINLRNQLARAEIHVANYYFSRKAYLAAANRGRFVVENFPANSGCARWSGGDGPGLQDARYAGTL